MSTSDERDTTTDLATRPTVEREVQQSRGRMGNGVLTRRGPKSVGWPGRLGLPGRLVRMSDRDLVSRAAAGDADAFGELYERYIEDVYRYLQLRLRDREQAEDLCQDVFLSAFRGLSDFRWQGAFRPWLLRVAHNRLANHWRTLGRSPNLTELPEQSEEASAPPLPPELTLDGDPSDNLFLQLDSEAASEAITSLTELQQQALALRFGLELSVAEAAATMGRSESAIKNLQYSALRKLRELLQEEASR